jgi:hypothetical protein
MAPPAHRPSERHRGTGSATSHLASIVGMPEASDCSVVPHARALLCAIGAYGRLRLSNHGAGGGSRPTIIDVRFATESRVRQRAEHWRGRGGELAEAEVEPPADDRIRRCDRHRRASAMVTPRSCRSDRCRRRRAKLARTSGGADLRRKRRHRSQRTSTSNRPPHPRTRTDDVAGAACPLPSLAAIPRSVERLAAAHLLRAQSNDSSSPHGRVAELSEPDCSVRELRRARPYASH